MKRTLLVLSVLLAGCSNNYKVGDCITINGNYNIVQQITKVNTLSYEVIFPEYPKFKFYRSIRVVNSVYEKADCPTD